VSKLYLLDPAAENDLREITRYTRKQWGKEQARIYHTQLKRCMKAYSEGSGFYKELNELGPDLRMGLCGHHYIFVQIINNAPAAVLGLFHERMNVIERLKERLET
jgi:toxin ParE1/3/4